MSVTATDQRAALVVPEASRATTASTDIYQRITAADAEKQTANAAAANQNDNQPDAQSLHNQRCTLSDDQAQHIARLRAERHADANFAPALTGLVRSSFGKSSPHTK